MSSNTELLLEAPVPNFPAIEPIDINLDSSFPSSEAPSEFLNTEEAENNEKNMLVKFDILNKLGMGSKMISPVSRDSTNDSLCFESDRKISIEEDDLIYAESVLRDAFINAEGDFSLELFQRSNDEVRQAYLNRLINMKILKLQPAKKHQEIIVLDWDDTLLCTSYLGKYGLVHVPEKILQDLKVLDDKVALLLETATSFGKTYIVTNAEHGWVGYTGMMFLPKSWNIIQEKVEIISARNKYSDLYPDDTYRWKVETFMELKKELDMSLVANILCIGDSRIEMEAARCLGEQLSSSLIKTIKFKQNPGVNDLIKQIDLLNQKFEFIITSRTSLTIRLEKKSA